MNSKLNQLTVLLIFAFIFGSSITSLAETGEALEPKPKLSEVFTNLPDDLKIWGRETFHKDNLVNLAEIGGMTAILVATDYETWQAVRKPTNQSSLVRQLANQGVSMGDGFFQFGIVGGFLAAGSIQTNRRALRTAAQISESIFATGIVVQVIKHATGRESPFSSEERVGRWRPFPNQIEYNKDFQKFDAVPSGHLSTATTTLFVIMNNYPEQKWIPYVGYPALAWISLGLVGTGIHWWSDFPIAIGLGYQFAKITTARNKVHVRANQSQLDAGGSSESQAAPPPQEQKSMFFPSVHSNGTPTLNYALEW